VCLDGRGRPARRLKQATRALLGELGIASAGDLLPSDLLVVRRLAALQVELESLEAARVAGAVLKGDDFVRVQNAVDRAMRAFRSLKRRRTKTRAEVPNPYQSGRMLADLIAQQ